MKRNILVVMCIGLAFSCLSATADQTNVLLIIADDLGIDSLSAFNDDAGASLPPTPVIDNIQSNGITFTRFYAYSTCSPTRSSIMTGRYSFRTGVLSPTINTLESNEFTLPEALIESGVISNRMAQIGKWHLGNNASSPNTNGGWPHFSGALRGAIADYYQWDKTIDGITTLDYTTYATTDNVNDGITWIGQQGTNSWFLWLAFNAPHTPLHRPPNDLHDYDGISDTGANGSRPHYEAMVQAMDTEIGRLISNVNLTNTTVIFMGDNGTPRRVIQPPFPSTHSKGSIYEGGIRVPLLIYGAAVSNSLKNTTYDGLLHSTDLYATILELFGVNADDVVPDELVLDSRSFAAVLRGGTYTRDPSAIMAQNDTGQTVGRSIIAGDYKYIDFDSGATGFYNVATDLPEADNLLDGALSPTEQAAYDSLTNKLATYVNTPQIYSYYMDGDGKLNVEIGWFNNEGFTLWRRQDLINGSWTSVAAQEFVDSGGAALILRDPSPPDTNAFYRVSTP